MTHFLIVISRIASSKSSDQKPLLLKLGQIFDEVAKLGKSTQDASDVNDFNAVGLNKICETNGGKIKEQDVPLT